MGVSIIIGQTPLVLGQTVKKKVASPQESGNVWLVFGIGGIFGNLGVTSGSV